MSWDTSLLGTITKPIVCIKVCFCDTCYIAQWEEDITGDSCMKNYFIKNMLCALCYCRCFGNMCGFRPMIREASGISGSCLSDCLAVAFCPLCSLVQAHQQMATGATNTMTR